LKIEQNSNYTVIEGSNKSKFLEKYLRGTPESGEIAMLDMITKLENRLSFRQDLNSSESLIDLYNSGVNVLDSHQQLALMVNKKKSQDSEDLLE